MNKKSEAPKNSKKMNLIFIAVILVLAGALALFGWLSRRDAHELCGVVIYEDNFGSRQQVLPLDENKTYDIQTRFDTVHIQVENGAVRFVDSPCPDHVCEQFGWLNSKGAFASCIPNQTFLSIEEKGDIS